MEIQRWKRSLDQMKKDEGGRWVDYYEVKAFIEKEQAKALTLGSVVGSLITADDEGTYFVVNTDHLDEIEKGSVVYLLNTYPENIHEFADKNGDEVWIDADDVDRKQ